MTVRLQSCPTVGFYQVRKKKMFLLKMNINAAFVGNDHAIIEKEFEYKDCCRDSKGKVKSMMLYST